MNASTPPKETRVPLGVKSTYFHKDSKPTAPLPFSEENTLHAISALLIWINLFSLKDAAQVGLNQYPDD
jgi:hypothetical protein